jgi:hypothetical protein
VRGLVKRRLIARRLIKSGLVKRRLIIRRLVKSGLIRRRLVARRLIEWRQIGRRLIQRRLIQRRLIWRRLLERRLCVHWLRCPRLVRLLCPRLSRLLGPWLPGRRLPLCRLVGCRLTGLRLCLHRLWRPRLRGLRRPRLAVRNFFVGSVLGPDGTRGPVSVSSRLVVTCQLSAARKLSISSGVCAFGRESCAREPEVASCRIVVQLAISARQLLGRQAGEISTQVIGIAIG